MSAKIYNGFSVETTSAVRLMHLIDNFRPYIQKNGQRLFNTFERSMSPHKSSYEIWRLWLDLKEELAKTGLRQPAVDTDFRLVFFPLEDRFLGIAFTEHHRWFKHWLKQPGVREYGYWSNSDKPTRISLKEWDVRCALWDRVLGYDTPASRGFTIDVHSSTGPVPKFRSKRTPS